MLFQPSNIYPSTLSGIGAGTVDVTQGLSVSWQVNGDTPMTAYRIRIYQNDSGSTLMYDSGSVSVSPAFETHDKYGNPTFYTTLISAASLSSAGIVNGYQYGYKMLITQWWGVSDYVEQTSASVFITRSLPTISIDAIANPVTSSSVTITATYAQAQGDPISTVEWVFAMAGSESNPIKRTGAVNTQILSFDADGLITGNTYSIMCNVVTANGMEASTGFVQFSVSYPSSSISVNYQLAQMKNSSAVYLSWDSFGANILAYPYEDSTKTTNGITFTVNGEGNISASGTASADAYFDIAEGTISDLGLTEGNKLVITSGYSGAKIVVTETNSSNVVVSTITGSEPLQYIVPSTTNTLTFSVVIPSGTVLSPAITLSPMLYKQDDIVAATDVIANINPIQSLNGYTSPWPAGGGKNKAGPLEIGTFKETSAAGSTYDSMKQSNSARLRSANLIPINGQQVTVSWSNYSNYGVCFTYFDSNGLYLGSSSGFQTWRWAVTTINNASVYYIACVVKKSDNSTVTDSDIAAVHLQVEFGSTATSYLPFSNICPISGRTGLTVYRTGKNLIPDSAISHPSNTQLRAWQDGTGTTLQAGTYTVSSTYGVVDGIYVNRYINGTNTTKTQKYNASSITFTINEEQSGFNFYFLKNGGNLNDYTIQLELGSTATDYEAYQDSTYTSDWTSVAGTVYGGSLDLVTGVLTLDRSFTMLNNLSWTYVSGYGGYMNSASIINSVVRPSSNNTVLDGLLCSAYKPDTASNTGTGNVNATIAVDTNGNLRVNDDAYTDKDTWLANVGSQTVVYPLATPLTYQLTPQQVTLLTTNNIWADSGDVSVSYTKSNNTQATVSGAIVTISDSKAVIIPTPVFTPGVTGVSIYRYMQGESILHHIIDVDTDITAALDYFAPSQQNVSYLLVAHSNSGDLFMQTNTFTPVFWFYSILLCSQDSNGIYHVSKEYVFKYGVETGAVSNNNSPTMQTNFTPYPNRQPISSLYKTGKLTGYIGKVDKWNRYSDSVSLQNAIYDISVSTLTKFLKSRKGDVIMADTSGAIQMQTEDRTTQQALKATVDWAEVGDASQVSIVSIPTDSFWPLQ